MTRSARRFFPVVLAAAVVLSSAIAAAADPGPQGPQAPPAPIFQAPWIGVQMDNGGDTGVRVEHVVRGSPADKGGVHEGDRIVGIDGMRVTQPTHVTRTVSSHKVGEVVKLDLERMGNAVQASIVLASRPSSDAMMKMDLVGAPAPAWTKVNPLGTAPPSVAALKGRVVLVDFWATWCGPCKMISPRLSQLKDKFGAMGLSVVGITTDEEKPAVAFSEKYGMHYPIVLDTVGETSRTYGVSALPTMILIDKNGVIRDVFIGFDPGGEGAIADSIKKLIDEKGPPAVPPPTVPRPDGR